MFFHTHYYHLKQHVSDVSPLMAFGCVLPDLSLTKIINFDELHKEKLLSEFIKNLDSDIEKGIRYHNTLDYYSHIRYQNNEPGFAYLNIPNKLPLLVEKSLGIEKKVAHVVAHNFIEAGLEFQLLNKIQSYLWN